MPIIRIEWFKGRTDDQKEAVARAITEVMQTHTQVKPESVIVVFADVDRGNWATAGRLASRPDARPQT